MQLVSSIPVSGAYQRTPHVKLDRRTGKLSLKSGMRWLCFFAPHGIFLSEPALSEVFVVELLVGEAARVLASAAAALRGVLAGFVCADCAAAAPL